MYGGQGADTLIGDDGDGSGAGGDDVLFGDRGDDDLYGDFGEDTLTGGLGADRFFFFSGEGIDRIIDFQPGEGDRIGIEIDINGTGIDTFAELQPRISGDGLAVLHRPGRRQRGDHRAGDPRHPVAGDVPVLLLSARPYSRSSGSFR